MIASRKYLFIFYTFGYLLLFSHFAGARTLNPYEATTWISAQGLKSYLIESHINPMQEVRLWIPAGSAYDPPGKEGLASFTAAMLLEGAADLDAIALREDLDFHGIALAAHARRDLVKISLTTLTEHQEIAWQRLADILFRPQFTKQGFQRIQERMITAQIKSKESPASQASRLFYKTLYPDHPYGHQTTGSEQSIKNIQLQDVKDFHQKYYFRQGSIITAAGDLTHKTYQSLIQRFFSHLPKKDQPHPPPIPTAKVTPAKVKHQHMAVPQTHILLGRVAIHRHDPDYFPLMILNQILGGSGLSSRLHHTIREKKGLAYAVYSYFAPHQGRGPWIISLQTKNRSVSEALTLVQNELKKLQTTPIPEKELSAVKRYLTGSFPLRLEGLDELANTWGYVGFYQRGDDYLAQWKERIEKVSQKDIQRTIQRLLDPQAFHQITVGQKANINAE
ncbi:M16 family metallopeptidase [Magnetococcales bacterium HHB-1]